MKLRTKSGTYLLTSYRWIGKRYWEWRRIGGPKSQRTWSKLEECKRAAIRHSEAVAIATNIGGN